MLKHILSFISIIFLLSSCASGPPIYNESYKGNYQKVQILLNDGISPNTAMPNGWTPLMIAAAEGHKDVVKLLIDNGADVNATNRLGRTSIMFAARYGFTEITDLLAKGGAKINIASDSITPLMAASINGHPKTVEKLIGLGADVNLSINGNDAFQCSLYNERSEVMKILLDNGALPNRKNANGVLPLQMAIYKNLNSIGNLLLSKGADPNLTTVIPPLTDLLAMAGPEDNKEISELIEAQKANKEAIENFKSGTVGMSSLMVATQYGNIEMVRALLNSGANIHFQNSIGGTALSYSRTFDQKEIENILIKAGALE